MRWGRSLGIFNVWLLSKAHSFRYAVPRLERQTSARLMAVTPTGPFCPFKSAATKEAAVQFIDQFNIYTLTPETASEVSIIQEAINTPDAGRFVKSFQRNG
jgi:hypothetical protein